MSIYNRTEQELLKGKSTAPGRVRTFLLHPEQHTTPHSCTRYEWDGNLGDLLAFASRALKGGSGVKITFPTNTKLEQPRDLGNWKVWIDENHPERKSIEKYEMIASPEDRLSGSFHIFKIEDSIEGLSGILDSWESLIDLADWNDIILDFSNIRAAGTQNSNGLIASGAESFLTIYLALASYLESGTIGNLLKLLGTLNHVMRRGGYKKGIITSAMSSECALIEEYLNVPIVEIEGSHKKGVILHESAFENPQLIDLIVESRNNESTFIEKPCREGLAFNVCVGLALAHKATCLIWRINLGMCQINEIVGAFVQAALDACELHTTWRDRVPELAAYYAPLIEDRQIGLDVMGLANLLAIEGVTYLDFADAIEHMLNRNYSPRMDDKPLNATALEIAYHLIEGYRSAKITCDEYMRSKGLPILDRIFTVEPAQNHAYETFDRVGKTTCRGIFAPVGRIVNPVATTGRESKRYFHGSVETDGEIGAKLHERLCDLWQITMDRTGRAHAISQDSWREMTPELLRDFAIARPSRTLYYAEAANYNQGNFLAKTIQDVEVCSIDRNGECEACAG